MSVTANDESHETGADEESDATVLSKDEAFHLLQNARRRAVLRYLLEEDEESYEMRDVAEAVAAWEHDTTVAQLDSDQRQRVYISLYQSHLPKLADSGIIHYNQDRGVVEPRPAIDLLEPYLEDGLDAEDDLTLDSQSSPSSGGNIRSGLSGVFSLLSY